MNKEEKPKILPKEKPADLGTSKIELPNAVSMREFSKKYDSVQWMKLTYNQKFLNLFCEDLGAAAIWAEKVLANKV